MTSSHLAGSVDQGSLIPNRGSLDPDDSSTSGDLSPNNWSMIIEQWTGGQINQLEKKYQKLVHNRCARCNLCNLSNTWHFYNTIAILISQNISKCRGHYRHFGISWSAEIIREEPILESCPAWNFFLVSLREYFERRDTLRRGLEGQRGEEDGNGGKVPVYFYKLHATLTFLCSNWNKPSEYKKTRKTLQKACMIYHKL